MTPNKLYLIGLPLSLGSLFFIGSGWAILASMIGLLISGTALYWEQSIKRAAFDISDDELTLVWKNGVATVSHPESGVTASYSSALTDEENLAIAKQTVILAVGTLRNQQNKVD